MSAVVRSVLFLHPTLSPSVSLQSVLNRMRVLSIPYALMKVNPLSWVQKVCSYKGNRSFCSSLVAAIGREAEQPCVTSVGS